MYRDKYFVCARTLHPDRTWATDSLAFPHILRLASGSSVVLVFLESYSLVGSSCSNSSIIPAIVCVGAARHSVIQEKHSPSSSSLSQRTVISFPCHFFSLVSSKRLLCTAFFAHTPIFRPSMTSLYDISMTSSMTLLLLLLLVLLLLLLIKMQCYQTNKCKSGENVK